MLAWLDLDTAQSIAIALLAVSVIFHYWWHLNQDRPMRTGKDKHVWYNIDRYV